MIKLKRLKDEPILQPNDLKKWERGGIFNAAAVKKDGLVYLIYRAVDYPGNSGYKYTSCLGCAISKDGINFNKLEDPIFIGKGPQETKGVEDPRIVAINGMYYMLYTGCSEKTYKICLAKSNDLITWERMGVLIDESNKDASFFPEKINNKYFLFHRRHPDIWIASSNDLKAWVDHKIVMKPIPSSDWECHKIGIAGPPFKTDYGWLLIYHGVDNRKRYSLGIALLDKNNPSNVIARQKESILEPELDWEVNGAVNNVVFSCGGVEYDDSYFIYYGGADTVIGVTKLNKAEIEF